MADLSNYCVNSLLLPFLFRGSPPSQPSAYYVGLCTTTPVASDTGTEVYSGSGGTGVEVSGGSYARQAYNPGNSNWASPSSQSTSNSIAITFPTATGSWGTLTGWGIFDASTNGNMIFFGALASSKTVGSGDTFSVPIGDLTAAFS